MPIRTAYISKLGRSYKISDHFTLGEYACKDGSDLVKYSTVLLAKLEDLRGEHFTIALNSAYRTAAYNKKIGGASNSQHIYGTAVDIALKHNGKPLDARYVCCRCQSMGFPGVAYISSTAVHLDDRASGTYRGDERKGYRGNVGGDFYKYFNLAKAEVDAYFAQFEPKKEPVVEPEKEKEEEEMTQDQFNAMMNNWISAKAAAEPSEWSAEARKWAEENGIIVGTGAGYSYESYCTREQMVMFLYRLAETLKK